MLADCDVVCCHYATARTISKMADSDVSFRQLAVIEFLVKEETFAAEIYLRFQRTYGDVCMGASSVRRWVKHFKVGNTSIQDEPRSRRPRTASMGRNKKELMSSLEVTGVSL